MRLSLLPLLPGPTAEAPDTMPEGLAEAAARLPRPAGEAVELLLPADRVAAPGGGQGVQLRRFEDPGSSTTDRLNRAAIAARGRWLWLVPHDSRPTTEAVAALLRRLEAVSAPLILAPLRAAGGSARGLAPALNRYRTDLDPARTVAGLPALALRVPVHLLVHRRLFLALGGVDPALGFPEALTDLVLRWQMNGEPPAWSAEAELDQPPLSLPAVRSASRAAGEGLARLSGKWLAPEALAGEAARLRARRAEEAEVTELVENIVAEWERMGDPPEGLLRDASGAELDAADFCLRNHLRRAEEDGLLAAAPTPAPPASQAGQGAALLEQLAALARAKQRPRPGVPPVEGEMRWAVPPRPAVEPDAPTLAVGTAPHPGTTPPAGGAR